MIRVFAAPLALAVISTFGLVAAFAFGETGHVLSWLGVGAPIAVIAWLGLRSLERFQAKWIPIRVKKTRQNNK